MRWPNECAGFNEVVVINAADLMK